MKRSPKMEEKNELLTHTGDWYPHETIQQQQKHKQNELHQAQNRPVCQTKQIHDSLWKNLVIMDDISEHAIKSTVPFCN